MQEIDKYRNRKKIVSIYDSWKLDISLAAADQKEELFEDMLQIVFKEGYLLDVGWYPSFSEKGTFKGVLIKDEDWESPIHNITTTNQQIMISWVIEIIETLTI